MRGIYINGLEMPKEDGVLCIVIHHDGKVCHFFDLQCEQIATAIPVPPHGRLIDADKTLYDLGRIVLPDDFAYTMGHDMAKRFIENAPTVIPADKEGE